MHERTFLFHAIHDTVYKGNCSKLFSGQLKYSYQDIVVITDSTLTTVITMYYDDQSKAKKNKLHAEEKKFIEHVSQSAQWNGFQGSCLENKVNKELTKKHNAMRRKGRANKYGYKISY